MNRATSSSPIRKRFLPLFLLGLTGIATIPFSLIQLLQTQPLPADAPRLPLPAIALLSLVQPALLLAVAVTVGIALAHRVGLHSRLLDRISSGIAFKDGLLKDIPVAIPAGIAVAVTMTALDTVIFKAALPEFFQQAQAVRPVTLGTTIMGVLYGGVTEELMTRWGAMSLFAFGAWRMSQRGFGPPGALQGALQPVAAWTAIALSALLFAVGHLPAAAMIGPLTPLLVLRVLALNTIAGLVFGWLFWKRSLEAAMLAHATVHVAFYLLFLTGMY